MTLETISANGAPDAIGPYSHAIRTGNTVYLSGQIALDPQNMELVSETFRHEARQAFTNVCTVLAAADAKLSDIVKITVYLTDLANFDTVNAVMSETLDYPFPARVAVGVASLPRGASIELDVIAVVND